MLVWLKFGLCAALIAAAGYHLSRYGGIIADKTGLGGTWIGLVLVATVTSLPELATGVSAVTVAAVPNIAVGDVLGSCVFNLALIVILDFLHRGESIYTRAGRGHILAAGFGVVLIGFVGFNLLLAERGETLRIGHVGAYTPVIVVLYLVAMRTVFLFERAEMARYVEQAADRHPGVTLRQAVLRYALAAVVVVGAGVWLPFLGAELAQAMGWHNTFVGTIFVAFATSVPELSVTIAALRLGAVDMAIGNLLGSNLFDILIIAIDDLLYLEGPILSHVSKLHAVSAFSAMIMTGIAIVGLYYRPRGRVFRTVGWASLFLFCFWVLNTGVLFLYGE
jgi:cation:H+ antiporter